MSACGRARCGACYNSCRKLATGGPDQELSQVGGGLGLLVPLVQELLHEIRLQKHIVAEQEGEMRRRVAVRTDALDRRASARCASRRRER